MQIYNLVSFAGIFVLLGLAWLISTDRKRLDFRLIAWGLGLQLLFALFVFKVELGRDFFLLINDVVVRILQSATAGTNFLFGRLALAPGTSNEAGESSLGFFLAFQGLPPIVFFAALVGLLYYSGIMPWLIKKFATVFTRLMGLSGAESLSVSSNIFVGIESALTIRPFLKDMTRSELCTILTAGMSTVASSVMALYVFILQGQFPTIAGHLVSASLLSAPAAVVLSKILCPETAEPVTRGTSIELGNDREDNFIEAIISGANNGMKLVVGIASLLLAFLGLAALIDLVLGFAGELVGLELSLRGLLSYIFYPFTLLIGVPIEDAGSVAKIIGERAILTEVTAYQSLAQLIAAGKMANPRSVVMATYALCGFAHIASLAIFVGGTAALAPNRTKDLGELGFRALIAATLACLVTAAVAGTVYTGGETLLTT